MYFEYFLRKVSAAPCHGDAIHGLEDLQGLFDGFKQFSAVAFLKMGDNSVEDDRDGVESVGCIVPPLKMVSIRWFA
jgi:hypothetical protein